MQEKITNILKLIMLYLSVAGTITFTLFILEESFQTVVFGAWPAQDAQRWDIVYDGTQMMSGIVTTINVVNYSFGWIQPLAFISYRAYAKSARYYQRSLQAKIFAHEPELFLDQTVEFTFRPKTIQSRSDGSFLALNGVMSQRPKKPKFRVSGRLEPGPKNKLIVDMQN